MSYLGGHLSGKMARSSRDEHFSRTSCANHNAEEATWLCKRWLKTMQREHSCCGRHGNHGIHERLQYSRSNLGPWWTHILTQQVQMDWRTDGRWPSGSGNWGLVSHPKWPEWEVFTSSQIWNIYLFIHKENRTHLPAQNPSVSREHYPHILKCRWYFKYCTKHNLNLEFSLDALSFWILEHRGL